MTGTRRSFVNSPPFHYVGPAVSDPERPNLDLLLAALHFQTQTGPPVAGSVFLGMAPGVGKTYAMLEAAGARRRPDDVVIGYVETAGRAETEALTAGCCWCRGG